MSRIKTITAPIAVSQRRPRPGGCGDDPQPARGVRISDAWRSSDDQLLAHLCFGEREDVAETDQLHGDAHDATPVPLEGVERRLLDRLAAC